MWLGECIGAKTLLSSKVNWEILALSEPKDCMEDSMNLLMFEGESN